MRGWKTWTAGAALAVLGAIDLINGDAEAGIQKIIGALGLIGLGHKIEKAG